MPGKICKSYAPREWQGRFHAAGATFRHRLVLKSNLAGGTVAVAAECAFHRRRSYPDWWRGWRFSLQPVMAPRLLVVAPGDVRDFRHSSLAHHLGRFGLGRGDFALLPSEQDFGAMRYEVVAMDEFPHPEVHADLIGKAVSLPGLSMLVGTALDDADRQVVSRYRPGERMEVPAEAVPEAGIDVEHFGKTMPPHQFEARINARPGPGLSW